MRLITFKEENRYSYRQLQDLTGIDKSILHRICEHDGYCVKLRDAHRIVSITNGLVGYEDLLNGDC